MPKSGRLMKGSSTKPESRPGDRGQGYSMNYWGVSASGTLKPMAYTRPHSNALDAFCNPLIQSKMTCFIFIPYPRAKYLKKLPFTVVHTLFACIWECPSPLSPESMS